MIKVDSTDRAAALKSDLNVGMQELRGSLSRNVQASNNSIASMKPLLQALGQSRRPVSDIHGMFRVVAAVDV